MKLLLPNPGLDQRIQSIEDLEKLDKEDGDQITWDNKAQFYLTCVGFCIGIGNVWRFPYLCQTHGGGAFLIPYLILLVLEGMPLLFVEFAIGQRLRKGSVGVWQDINPYLAGIGIASMILSLLVGLYYNTLIAWIIWYLFNSLQSPLPWTQCPLNENRTGYVAECQQSSSVDYFYYRVTLDASTSIADFGGIHWPVLACLLVAWTLAWLSFMKGIVSTGKVVYVTAILPYVVLFIFLVRGATLKGALTGIKYLFTPKIEALISPITWLHAGAQVCFSLGIGFGGLISFSRYNPIHNNCRNDALFLGTVTAATAIFAASVTYTVVGFRATEQYEKCISENMRILKNAFDLSEQSITPHNYDEVLKQLNNTYPGPVMELDITTCNIQTFLQGAEGPGLAFIVFTEAIINMPVSPLWSILFFVMLLSLGLSSLIGTFEGVLGPLRDVKFIQKNLSEEVMSGAVFLISFFISFLFAQRSGMYWVSIFDTFAGSLPPIFLGFFEMIVVVYIYGIERFNEDIKFMIGFRPSIFWQATWRFISPLIILVIFIFYLITQAQSRLAYLVWDPNSEKFPSLTSIPYPGWIIAVIFALAGSSSLTPIIYALCRRIYISCKKD